MRLIKSFGYAFKGLALAIREQRNLRIHLAASAVVVSLGFYFNVETWEWCVLVTSMGLVLSLELFNTAIENLTDLAAPELNPQAGKTKDISAAAVLIGAITTLVVAVIIFGRYLWRE